MLARDRTFAIRVGKYQTNDIKEASFDYGYIKGDTFKPGGTCAGSVKVTFTSIITAFKKLDKVYPEIGLLVGNAYEWVKMGEYFINDVEIDRNRNLTTLDLMDGMFKFNKPFETGLSYPAQIRDVIREICAKTGVTLQTDNLGLRAIQHHIQKKPDKKDITYREVLSQAVQLLGFSAFFNRDGKLEIRGLTESNITITADSYFLHGLTKSEIEYQIAGITCKVKDKEVLTVGLRTGRSLELENSFMNQNLLDALYYDLKNLKYYPFNLNYQGHLKLQVGQWVIIKTNKNETFKVPVLNQSFKFQGGLSARISADSKAGNDAQYSYGGFYAKRIEQANTDMAAEVQQQLEYAESEFNKQTEKFKGEVKAGIDKAKNESQAYADRLNQAVTSKVQEVNQLVIANKAEQDKQYKETLAKAGASSDLAKQAQNLATQVRDDLNKVKQTATQAQSQVNSQIDQVKKDVGAIRNQQTAYEQTNTQNLARITGQLGDKASKSEVEQTADGIREELASLSVGGRNLALGTSKEWSTPFTNFSGNPNIWSPLYKVLTDGLQVGDTLRSKIILKYTDVRPATGKTATVGLQGNGNVTGWTDGAYNGSPAKTLNGSGEITFEHSFKITENHLKNAYWNWMFRTDFIASGSLQWRLAKVESGSVFTNWSPAPEDAEGLITEAKATFERTAQGLRTDLTAVQSYVNADGTRAEALRTYSREETARQLTAERKVIEAGYVAKAQHTEDVRGLTNRFEELKTSSETNLAEYKQSVEGRFTTISQQIAGKASQTDFQRVQETSRLYERIIGSNEDDISNKVARMALTNQLFQVEVGKYANVGGPNMLRNSRADDGLKYWTEADGRLSFTTHTFYFNGQKRIFELRPGAVVKSPRFIVKRGGEYMLNMLGFDANSKSFKIYFCKRKKGAIPEYQEKQVVFVSTGSPAFSSSQVVKKSFKFNVEDFDEGFLQFEYEKQDLNRWGGLFMTELDFYEGMTDRLWQPAPEDATLETDKTLEATQTKMTQLAGSWAVKNINSAGDLISGLNLGANGVNRLDGRLTHITGQTLIDNAVIKSAMIDKLKTANFESGSVTTQILATDAVTADKLRVDYALINKLTADDALLNNLVAKQGFINKLSTIDFSATQIKGGILKSLNNHSTFDLQRSTLTFKRDDDFTIVLDEDGLYLKKQNEKLLGLTYSQYPSYSHFARRGTTVFEISSGTTLAVSTSRFASNFIEFYPDEETVYIRSGFKLDFGGGQSVALEHVYGTLDDVDYSAFRVLGTDRDELRFFRDGRIELYHEKY